MIPTPKQLAERLGLPADVIGFVERDDSVVLQAMTGAEGTPAPVDLPPEQQLPREEFEAEFLGPQPEPQPEAAPRRSHHKK